MSNVVYISGPMTGLPELNYPAFNSAAEKLRTLGYIVENPAEAKAEVWWKWEDYMRSAIVQVTKSDTIVTLPNWENSRGAKIEVKLGFDLGLEVYTLVDFLKGQIDE